MLKATLTLVFCIAVLAAAIYFAGHSSCEGPPKQNGENAETHKNDGHNCATPYSTFKVGLNEGWRVAHEYHEEIIAVATVFIAVFTIILGLFTISLAASTDKLVRGAERTERRQLRAYVGVHEIETELPNLKTLSYEIPDYGQFPPNFIHKDFITIIIKNYGQTPARSVLTVVNWQPFFPFGSAAPDDFDYRDQDLLNTISTAGRSIIDRDNTHFTTVNLNKLIGFRDASNKKCSLYIYGHIDYTDIYDRRWRREFNYLWEPWRPKRSALHPQN